jgi:hypothetical protein
MGRYPRIKREHDSVKRIFYLVDGLLHVLLDLSDRLVGLPLPLQLLIPGQRPPQLPSPVPSAHRICRSPWSILLIFPAVSSLCDSREVRRAARGPVPGFPFYTSQSMAFCRTGEPAGAVRGGCGETDTYRCFNAEPENPSRPPGKAESSRSARESITGFGASPRDYAIGGCG